MKLLFAISLVGLACMIGQCLASPTPSPMFNKFKGAIKEKLRGSGSDSGSGSSNERGSRKTALEHAIEVHEGLMREGTEVVHDVGTTKKELLEKGRKYRDANLPLSGSLQIVLPPFIDNSELFFKTSQLKDKYEWKLPKLIEKAGRHNNALKDHPDPRLRLEAVDLHNGLIAAKSWATEHPHDDDVSEWLEKMYRHRPDASPRVPKGTEDIDKERNEIDEVLSKLPKNRN